MNQSVSKTLKEAISVVEQSVDDPRKGLNDDVFYFIGRHTPFINVDALVQLSTGEIVLTWRDDIYTGQGWHIPGGIIRFQERMETRLRKVVQSELGVKLENFVGPTQFNQIIAPQVVERSHFLSLLFICKLSPGEEKKLRELAVKNKSYYLLTNSVPEMLLSWHEIYREEIKYRTQLSLNL